MKKVIMIILNIEFKRKHNGKFVGDVRRKRVSDQINVIILSSLKSMCRTRLTP